LANNSLPRFDTASLSNAVLQFITDQQINAGSGTVVAVSGGVDSVVLLHVFSGLRFPVVVAHCNFGLRGEESDGDEEFVKSLAEKSALAFHRVRFETVRLAAEKKQSIQVAARELRYDWLEQLRRQLGFAYIATAHQANDNAETILQHVVDGTGLSGLRGIPPVNANVVRPFIFVTKEEILNYAAVNEINYRNDSSNLKTDYTRNKIRLDIMPKLSELNPSIVGTLNANAERWQRAYDVYHQAVSKIKNTLTVKRNDDVVVNLAALRSQVSAETILYELLKDFGFNSSQAAEIFKSLDAESGKQFFSPTHRVVKDRKHLIVGSIGVPSVVHLVGKGSGVYNLPDGKLEFETIDNSTKINFDTTRYQYLNADELQFPLTIRAWKKGDYFYPFGLNKKKKLSDYFSDKKLSLPDKERRPVLLSQDHVVALPGFTIDHRFQVKPTTKKVLKLRYQNTRN